MVRDQSKHDPRSDTFQDADDAVQFMIDRANSLIEDMRKGAETEIEDDVEDIIKGIQDNVIGELNGLRAKIELRNNGVAA